MPQIASWEKPRRPAPGRLINRDRLVAWYRRNRERSRLLFDLLTQEDTHYSQPIALRHPFIFYEGHIPTFSLNTLVKRGLGETGIDSGMEALFARGIDPPTDQAAGLDAARHRELWPSRRAVVQFTEAADARVIEALMHADIERPGHPLLDRAEAAFVILEHEVMHQETLLYMLHRLPFALKRAPEGYRTAVGGAAPRPRWIEIGPGVATLGTDRQAAAFAWDNEGPRHSEAVPGFAIESCNVTNAAFMEFVSAGGYRDPRWWNAADWDWVCREELRHPPFWERRDKEWVWRGLFEAVSLPAAWPVYVSHAEAAAYARWRGARLPTEAEFQRAAFGAPSGEERPFPWGEAAPEAGRHGVFDFTSWDPKPAGSHPDGRSAWDVDDLIGNGWEWTSTPFGPFPGFRPMAAYPEYSADFFDGDHFVMKGASPATARELIRPTFRNWFRGRYPFVYAAFRCAKDRA